MGSLFDELKKSKLIDKKRARQLEHEQRVERKQGAGDVERDAALAAKTKGFEQRRAAEKEQNRERERQRQAAAKAKERRAEVKQLVRSRALGEESAGRRRWHFETPSGALPFVPVDESTGKRLQGGELAIVLDPNESWPRYVIVPRDVALALRRADAASVCWLAGA